MNILIYDDNKNDVDNLLNCINHFFLHRNYKYHVNVCRNNTLLFNNLNHFDLIILNIEVNKETGIDIGLKIREINQNIRIILTSDNTNHLLDGYKIHADIYFVKPIMQKKFDLEFEIIIKEYFSRYEGLDDYKICPHKIFYSDIVYIEFLNRKTHIHLSNGTIIDTPLTLKYWNEKLVNQPFSKPHKAYLLNLEYIKDFINDNILLFNGEIIHLSRNYKKDLSIAYVNYLHTKH